MEALSANHLSFISLLIIVLASSFTPQLGAKKPYQEASTQFIRTSCSSTTYPTLCFTSLSKHAAFIQTNRVLLTGTALNVTLASAKSSSSMVSALSKRVGLAPKEAAAMRDCLEELGDSVDELRKSIGEMGELRLRDSQFEVTMSDVQTWVSAALTDESTCTDGFQGASMNGNVKNAVRSRVVQLAKLTSNALALINQLASLQA